MNQIGTYSRPERPNGAAHLFSRIQRYRTLLRKRWWVLVLTVGAAVGIQFYLVSKAPASFVSRAQMIIGTTLALPSSSMVTEEMGNFIGTQIALMRGNYVASRAEARVRETRPDLEPTPVRLDVALMPKTSIFLLEARGPAPKYTQAYLDACMDEYMKYRQQMRIGSTDSTIKAIADEVQRVESLLHTNKQVLLQFQRTNNVSFMQEESASDGKRLVTLRDELADLQSQYRLIESLTPDLPRPTRSPKDSDPVAAAEIQDQNRARQQIELLKAQREELGIYLRPKHPKMVRLAEEIANQERLLGIYLRQSRQQLDNLRESLRHQIATQQKILQEWEAKALDSSRRLAEYENLRANIDRSEGLYAKLLATLDTLKLNVVVPNENMSILERASTSTPDNAGLAKHMLIGCFIGLVFGIGILFLVDRFDDRPVTFTELQGHFEELILGQIPEDLSRNGKRQLQLLGPNDTRYAYAEACRNLRSSLIFMAVEGSRPRTLVVTSAIPGEGKSTVVANLAITMAQAGSRVLLVDADLRKGSMHEHFGADIHIGLAEVLSGQVPLVKAVQATATPNLYLLTRGTAATNPGELLLSRADAFLKEAGPLFDFVLFDTAPVLAADDTASLAPRVDGVLFVIRAAYTSARLARAALDLLYQRQVNVMGLVFNSVENSSREYNYFNYPDYYRPRALANK